MQRGVLLASIAVLGMVLGVGASTRSASAVAVADSCFTVSGSTITNYDATTCALNPDIPASISGTPITTIGLAAFRDKNLTGVTFLGNNLTTIDTNAFYGNSLGTVTLPNSVTTLGVGAFMRAGLTNVTLSTGLTTINDQAFYVNNLSSIALHEGITDIGFSAFGLNHLTSLTLPSTLRTINYSAFANNNLTSLSLNNGLTTIGDDVFSNNRLASVTIPNSVTSLGATTFFQNQLTSVTLGTGLTSLDDATFAGNKLVSVTIPSTITTINDYAFTGQNPWGSDWPTAATEPARTNATWFTRLILADPSNPHSLHDFASEAPEYIADEMIWLPGGHLIDAAPLTINYLDSAGASLQASSIKTSDTTTDYTIGQNPSLNLAIYYRLGDTLTLTPPAIAGFTTPSPADITIGATGATHTFVYAAASTPSSLAPTGSSNLPLIVSTLALLMSGSLVIVAKNRLARR